MTPSRQQAEDLRRDLARIHDELHGAERIDPETRALLERTMEDIRTALARVETGSGTAEAAPQGRAPADEEVGPFREALERLAVNLESSNPRLAAGVNRLSQTLANMGI